MSRPSEAICEVAQNGLAVLVVATTVGRSRTFGDDYHPKPGAKACPVAKTNCVSCHMPKLDLPGAHYKFTDHRIRIVKPNEPYPG